MIINIKNKEGTFIYDTSKIEDENRKIQSDVLVRKVEIIEVVKEALGIAGVVQRKTLEDILEASPEAFIDSLDDNDNPPEGEGSEEKADTEDSDNAEVADTDNSKDS